MFTSYTLDLDFGFIENEFIGVERAEQYTVNLAFFSGNVRLGGGFIVDVTLHTEGELIF